MGDSRPAMDGMEVMRWRRDWESWMLWAGGLGEWVLKLRDVF